LDLKDLQKQIEQKRRELDKLVLSQLKDLSADEIVALSNELDHLIAVYIDLIQKKKKP
jgi:hypothetical protein